MPSKSPAQARLMRAVAHGWKKPGGGGPSPAVAREFVDADKRVNMYEGGLAPMTDIVQRGMAPGLNFQEGGEVDWGVNGLTIKQLAKQLGGGIGGFLRAAKGIQSGQYFHDTDSNLIYLPQQTATGMSANTTPGYDPYYGAGDDGPVSSGPRNGGPRGRRGGGPRGGRRRNGGGSPPPPRDIPGALPPGRDDTGGLVPPTATPYTPPDRRAGRDTPYSQALRAHKARVAASLAVPPGGYAEGGAVRRYQEGGAVRPGHAEGPNPFPEGSARYKLWERKNHIDPPPPPPPPAAAEELSWLERLMGKESDRQTRTERELEEMEEARGGYIDGYANGGLASFARAPRGGVPPRMGGMMKPRMGGVPPRIDPRAMPPQQTVSPRLPMKPAGYDPRGGPIAPPPGKEPGGIPGGPMVPPNLRGHMQRARMMNRPRRGMPGPAGAGGAPQNRVGQSDQQGGLARALQRGTGRPPMSRRSGFYR